MRKCRLISYLGFLIAIALSVPDASAQAQLAFENRTPNTNVVSTTAQAATLLPPLLTETPSAVPPANLPFLPKNTQTEDTETASTSELDSTEDRLRVLEVQNARLRQDLQSLFKKYDTIANAKKETRSGMHVPYIADVLAQPYLVPDASGGAAVSGTNPRASTSTGPFSAAPRVGLGEEDDRGFNLDFQHGLRLSSNDHYYEVEFHDLSQGDYRTFDPSGHPLSNNFSIPRQRLYFTGSMGSNVDFYSVINRGYGSLDILDSFMNYKVNPAVNFRIGRFKMPYTYEYYKIAESDLLAPERSVYIGNLSPNRQIGAMMFGRLFDNQFEYATAVSNGPHHSFNGYNNAKDLFLFTNVKPFLYSGVDFLENMNFAGSINWGRLSAPLEPNALHTANDETTNAAVNIVSPTFFIFNPAATEVGDQTMWAGEFVWFYHGLTVLAGYNGGFMNYQIPSKPVTHVPYEGVSATATYFLTGEEPTSRKEVEPLRDFSWRNPGANPGAWEIYHRTAYFNAGTNIFSYGLGNPNLYTNSAWVFDTGANWYLNKYLRVFLDWQLSEFGSPIQISPGGRKTNSMNIYWFRTQVWF